MLKNTTIALLITMATGTAAFADCSNFEGEYKSEIAQLSIKQKDCTDLEVLFTENYTVPLIYGKPNTVINYATIKGDQNINSDSTFMQKEVFGNTRVTNMLHEGSITTISHVFILSKDGKTLTETMILNDSKSGRHKVEETVWTKVETKK